MHGLQEDWAMAEQLAERRDDRRDLAWLQESTAATVTIAATAEVLDVDERTVTRAIQDGQLPAVRVGRRWLIPRLRLLALLVNEQRLDGVGAAAS
jgi:excisionase family DNA binding protein